MSGERFRELVEEIIAWVIVIAIMILVSSVCFFWFVMAW